MKSLLKKSNPIIEGNASSHWKRRPSEIRGYQRALYCNADNGDYIRVDFNIKDKRIRIYLEAADEGGISYYSIIEKGVVVSEKNLSTGRSVALGQKLAMRADVLATIPSRDILNLIGNNYSVQAAIKEIHSLQKKKKLETTRKKYFSEDDGENEPIFGDFDSEKQIKKIDIIDISLGIFVAAIIYLFTFNIIVTGVFGVVYGFALGIVDMMIRGREPIFFKILFFVLFGFGLYVYGNFFY